MEHLDLSQWTRYTKKKKYSFQSHNDLLFRIEKKGIESLETHYKHYVGIQEIIDENVVEFREFLLNFFLVESLEVSL